LWIAVEASANEVRKLADSGRLFVYHDAFLKRRRVAPN
jgi:hypothetical protein